MGCLCVHTPVTSPWHGVWGGYTLRRGCSPLAGLIWCLSSQLCLGLPSLPRLPASRVHEETKASLRPSYLQSKVKKLKWVSRVLSHPLCVRLPMASWRAARCQPPPGAGALTGSPLAAQTGSSQDATSSSDQLSLPGEHRGRPGTPISAAPLGQRGARYTSTLGSGSWISLHFQFLPPKAHRFCPHLGYTLTQTLLGIQGFAQQGSSSWHPRC